MTRLVTSFVVHGPKNPVDVARKVLPFWGLPLHHKSFAVVARRVGDVVGPGFLVKTNEREPETLGWVSCAEFFDKDGGHQITLVSEKLGNP
jgi:hypothetical protein